MLTSMLASIRGTAACATGGTPRPDSAHGTVPVVPLHTRAKPARVALVIGLLGALLSACGVNRANSQPSASTPAAPATASPRAHVPQIAGARGAGINVEPSYRPWRYAGGPAPQSWWCVPPNCSPDASPILRIDQDLTLARQLGVNLVRVEFPWRFLEPERGIFDWSRADLIVRAADALGVALQPIVVYTPAWSGAPTAAPAPQDFRAFMSALVARYHSSIHYWELWNEPDLSKYWSAGEQAYVDSILIPGYQGVKSADPNAHVVLGGPSWGSPDWMNRIYQYGGGNSFDILSWHAYGGVDIALESAQNMRQILVAHQQTAKPLWIGEYGVQDYTVGDTAQASLITSVLTSSSPIAQADWYTLRDEDAMSCCPPTTVVSGSYGLVRRDGMTLKQGFYALQHLIAAGLPVVDQSHG